MPSVNPGPATSSVVNLQPVVGSFDNSGNVLQIYGPNMVPLTMTGFTGVTNASNASAGQIGEVISSSVAGTATGLTTATPLNVTSVTLTAGDWDVSGSIVLTGDGSTSFTIAEGGFNTTTATLPATNSLAYHQTAALVPATVYFAGAVPHLRVNVSTTTIVYLVAQATFTVSTAGAGGTVIARRVR